MLEMALKPSNWAAWWDYVVTQEITAEEYAQRIDYDGTRLAAEIGVGVGDNWKGMGIGVALKPDNTFEVGGGASLGPVTVARNPQDGALTFQPRIPLGGGTALKPKYGPGTWGITVKPPIGVSVKAGENRFGHHVGVGYTQGLPPMNVSAEVTAYGGMVDTTVDIAQNNVWAQALRLSYWQAAQTVYMLSVISSYRLLGSETTKWLFFPDK